MFKHFMSVEALALGASVVLVAPGASAQALSRLSARIEGGASLFLSSSQSDDFGVGFAGRLDVGAYVAGPLRVFGYGAFHRWPSSDTQVGEAGAATLLGAGLGVEPSLASRVRLRIEGDVGASFNGAEGDTRLTWGAALGAWFRVASVLDVGPFARLGSIMASSNESSDQGGPGSAMFLTFGVGLSLHGAAAEPTPTPLPEITSAPVPSPPAVTNRSATTTAPAVTTASSSTTDTTFDPSAQPLPVMAPPEPVATPVPVTTPPVPVATPAAPVAAEEGGRHHRRRHRDREGRSERSERRHRDRERGGERRRRRH